MHELSIVDALIEQVQQEVDRSGQRGRIVRLDLIVGRLAGVCCDSITFAFELLSAGTPLERAQLHITESKAASCCRKCNARAEIDEIAIRCPECGSTEITIDGGRELLLQSIEIEE